MLSKAGRRWLPPYCTAVYGKNGTGRKLAALVGQEITVRFKEGDYGWFAVAVK